MQNELISIGKTAQMLGISIDTLRRWDKGGRFQSVRSGSRGHRYYLQPDIEQFLHEEHVIAWAQQWATAHRAMEPASDLYCQTRDVFQARLEKLQSRLIRNFPSDTVSLVIAVAGEIGNNSFDHNLGNWPDVAGIFFSHSIRNREIVLADRGQGILATLKRVKPELSSAREALRVAFTETISGRLSEARGNGLKFVRSVIINNPCTLEFQTGDAKLFLKQYDTNVIIKNAEVAIGGCFAIIGFEESI